MYINHFCVWWPISCGPLNNENVLTEGKGLDVRSVCPSPGPHHANDSFLKRANRSLIKHLICFSRVHLKPTPSPQLYDINFTISLFKELLFFPLLIL